MFIIQPIKHIPIIIYNGCYQIALWVGPPAKNLAIKVAHAPLVYFTQTDYWQHHGKPFYQRNIQPLKKEDYILLLGSAATTAAIAALAFKFFVLAFPLVMGVNALLFFGACSLTRNRINKHFNEIAFEHVDQIRRTAHGITYKNQKFGDVSRFRAMLEKPEFSHIKDDVKGIDDAIQKFHLAVLKPEFEEKQKIVDVQLNALQALVQAHPQDKDLIEVFVQEVKKIGSQQQNLEMLETQKLKLQTVQTPAAILSIKLLIPEINLLITYAQNARIADSKKSLIEYLEGLLRKLAAHKTFENLTAIDVPNVVPANQANVANKVEKENKVENDKNNVLPDAVQKDGALDKDVILDANVPQSKTEKTENLLNDDGMEIKIIVNEEKK